MRKLRWGVISTGRIGRTKVVPAMQRGHHSDIVALASRDLARGRAVAGELGIPGVFGSYDALLADPGIEAVYICTPNHLHVPLSLQALRAGKHVLCEKPIGLNAREAETLLDEARRHPHLKIMEAFMYRHHPQWQQARAMVREGRIGTLRTIQSIFSYRNVDPANVRNQADIGGGGLMDIGCYNVSLSRFIFEDEPRRVSATMTLDPVFKTDVLTSGLLEFAAGTSTFTCSTQIAPYQRVHIFGTDGRIEIEIPFNAPPDASHHLWLHRDSDVLTTDVGHVDQYTIQGDLFALAVLHDTPVPTPLTDAVANMRVIDAVVTSAQTGAPV
jgi:predicted dehydrogenase